MANALVLDVLQVGFAGLAFLLAFLAYRLLEKETSKPQSSEHILKSIRTYMLFAFAMGGLAIGAQVFEKTFVHTPEDFERRLAHLNERIDGIRLTSVDAGSSPTYRCGQQQRSPPGSAIVMAGLRDGTSCRVPNINYYTKMDIAVPK